MDTFPYDSWDDAIAAAQSDAASAPYFTFGTGADLVVLTLIAIALVVFVGVYLVGNEARHLNAAADRLSDKYARSN